MSFIHDDPTAGAVVGGIDQAANTWWRNRATLGINAATPENQNLVTTLQKEWRQLRRYGGAPDLGLARSDFLEAYETEVRAKSHNPHTCLAKPGRIGATMGDVSVKCVAVLYDQHSDRTGTPKSARSEPRTDCTSGANHS